MLIYNDIVSGKDIATDSYPMKELADGAVLALESKKVQVGGEEIDIGGNASAEDAGEGVEDEVKTVINLVEAHGLQQISLDKKEYKALQKNYWKALLDAINKKKAEVAFGDASEAPTDKAELKTAMDAKVAAMSAYQRMQFDEVDKKLASFKKQFSALQKFVTDEIVANFDEYDFYIAAEPASLEQAMIIPARYIGEASAPTFYIFSAGVLEEKA